MSNVSHMNREDALKALVEAELPIAQAIARMSKFVWDSEEYLAVLTPENLERVLNLFTEGHQVSQFVENFTKNGCQISIGKPSGIIRRKITVTVSCNMFPTHDTISSFESKLGMEAERFGGRTDGWGCFVQKVA